MQAAGLPTHSFPQSHDQRGNLLNDGKRVLQWDAFNRLREVRTTTGTLLAVYTYDALHRRVRQTIPISGLGDSTLDFAYSGWDVLEERRTTDGATVRQYVEGVSVDEHLELTSYVDTEGAPQTTIQGRYLYHQNAQGSVAAITDSTCAVVESYVYDPYGKHAVRSGLTGSLTIGGVSSVGNRYTYSGRSFDHATGYLFYRYRLYDPEQGRFINQDPIEYLGGPNLYGYVSANPLYYTDPLGRNEIVDTAIWFPWYFLTSAGRTVYAAGGLVVGRWDIAENNSVHGQIHEMETFHGQYDRAVGVSDASFVVSATAVAAIVADEMFAAAGLLSDDSYDDSDGGSNDDADTPPGPDQSDPTYNPDRDLPQTKHGVPTPDVDPETGKPLDCPHTQLGRNANGEPAAREWMPAGEDPDRIRATRRVDYTDHGLPDHTAPHQHPLVPNNPRIDPDGGYRPMPGEPLTYPSWAPNWEWDPDQEEYIWKGN